MTFWSARRTGQRVVPDPGGAIGGNSATRNSQAEVPGDLQRHVLYVLADRCGKRGRRPVVRHDRGRDLRRCLSFSREFRQHRQRDGSSRLASRRNRDHHGLQRLEHCSKRECKLPLHRQRRVQHDEHTELLLGRRQEHDRLRVQPGELLRHSALPMQQQRVQRHAWPWWHFSDQRNTQWPKRRDVLHDGGGRRLDESGPRQLHAPLQQWRFQFRGHARVRSHPRFSSLGSDAARLLVVPVRKRRLPRLRRRRGHHEILHHDGAQRHAPAMGSACGGGRLSGAGGPCRG